jgi:hypothetical protein
MIVVDLLLATICFTAPGGVEECHPALVGKTTPVGEFTTIQRLTEDPGYGGDVIKFKETDKLAYSIHRVWLENPKEKRRWRLEQDDPKLRVISQGCINLDEKIYDRLLECCVGQPLKIQ